MPKTMFQYGSLFLCILVFYNIYLFSLFSWQAGLRSQDVKLMKSLITINDSIQQLSPKTKKRVSQSIPLSCTKKCVGVNLRPMATVTEEPHLVRRQSVPNFYKMNDNNSGLHSSNKGKFKFKKNEISKGSNYHRHIS